MLQRQRVLGGLRTCLLRVLRDLYEEVCLAESLSCKTVPQNANVPYNMDGLSTSGIHLHHQRIQPFTGQVDKLARFFCFLKAELKNLDRQSNPMGNGTGVW